MVGYSTCDECMNWTSFTSGVDCTDNRQMAELRVELRRMREAEQIMKNRIEE